MSREITMEEVRQHKTEASCWVVIRGKVYALTEEFITRLHPGGPIIMDAAGRDGTILFEDQAHSEEAKEVLNAEFFIGTLKKE